MEINNDGDLKEVTKVKLIINKISIKQQFYLEIKRNEIGCRLILLELKSLLNSNRNKLYNKINRHVDFLCK